MFDCVIFDVSLSGNSRSYQQWMHTVKKGSALINTAMTKATPAVKTAYKFVRSSISNK